MAGSNHKAVGEKVERRGEELTLTVFAMHVFAGAGWGGNGRGVWSRTFCLSVCLTGKLHPSYLSGNRGMKNVINKREEEVHTHSAHSILGC